MLCTRFCLAHARALCSHERPVVFVVPSTTLLLDGAAPIWRPHLFGGYWLHHRAYFCHMLTMLPSIYLLCVNRRACSYEGNGYHRPVYETGQRSEWGVGVLGLYNRNLFSLSGVASFCSC